MNIRENKGITIVSLSITISLLLIIAGISITGALIGVKETEETKLISELTIIQHAILERYTSSILTKEPLPGEIIEKSEVQTIIDEMNQICNEDITLKGKEYKRLTKQELKNIGIDNQEYSYIVNYKTGEIINETIKTTETKKPLYVYSKVEE